MGAYELIYSYVSFFVYKRYDAQAAEGEGANETAENETVECETAVTDAASAGAEEDINGDIWESNEADIPFLHLQLDIPNTPLFKDSQGGNIIPQVTIALHTYDNMKK
jgi:hypothetical protein